MRRNPLNVVLIEDDEVDVEAVARCLDKLEIPYRINVFHNGLEALASLREERQNLKQAHPFFVLLDLNMPKMTGIELLESMRQDPLLKAAVVFVLTVSDRASDIIAAYERQAAGYLIKSRLGADYELLADLLQSYYQVVEFPA